MMFQRENDAERWLALLEADVVRGKWSSPTARRIILGDYADQWVRERQLQRRTRELYESLLRNHIRPYLGSRSLDKINSQAVRTWRHRLITDGRSPIVAAKSYRLLRAVLNTAVNEDRLLPENPCRMRGYDKEETAERPIGSVSAVIALSELIARRYRALVLFAAFTGLRWGEIVALRAVDLDLKHEGTVRVARKFAELQDGRRVAGPPKSSAGVRTVALPAVLIQVVREHLAEFPASADELIFRGPHGAALRRNNFHRSVDWSNLVVKAGLPVGFHFHDLRHTGNNLAAASGASTRELMHRMGHGSMRAALIYQHATSERDREIATALDVRIGRETGEKWPVSGPATDNGPLAQTNSGDEGPSD
jgi:integrase